jgi:hypothetical protein
MPVAGRLKVIRRFTQRLLLVPAMPFAVPLKGIAKTTEGHSGLSRKAFGPPATDIAGASERHPAFPPKVLNTLRTAQKLNDSMPSYIVIS